MRAIKEKALAFRLALVFMLVLLISSTVFAYSAKITNTAGPAEGDYYLIPEGSNLCLGVSSWGKTSTGPALKALGYDDRNRWYVDHESNGRYTLINYASGWRLEAKSEIIQSSASNGVRDTQKWYIMKHKNAYIIQSAVSKSVMGTDGYSLQKGASARLQSWGNKKGQNWILMKWSSTPAADLKKIAPATTTSAKKVSKSVSTTAAGRTAKLYSTSGPNGGLYYLVLKSNPSYCLTMKSTGVNAVPVLTSIDNAKLSSVPQNYPSSCVWNLSDNTGGYYNIYFYPSPGRMLGACNGTKEVNGKIFQRSKNDNKGVEYNSQRWYIMERSGSYVIQSSISKLVMGPTSAKAGAAAVLKEYNKNSSSPQWILVKHSSSKTLRELLKSSNIVKGSSTSASESTTSEKVDPTKNWNTNKQTINGRRTLKTYLYNAFIPCGRTLYIWGGGWGGMESDTSVIGYQPEWNAFFKSHNTDSYDYTAYRYNYGKGLDCSGFAGWVLYNTMFTKPKQKEIMMHSTSVASYYAENGWATLSTDPSSATYYPGDVVSMNGHVWISLGECSDGSVLVIHSSPKGVQISGTTGKAYTLACKYMKKYFPEWPYEARCVGSSYLRWAGKAKWKIGSLLKDPDGMQKKSGEEILRYFLGTA